MTYFFLLRIQNVKSKFLGYESKFIIKEKILFFMGVEGGREEGGLV